MKVQEKRGGTDDLFLYKLKIVFLDFYPGAEKHMGDLGVVAQ